MNRGHGDYLCDGHGVLIYKADSLQRIPLDTGDGACLSAVRGLGAPPVPDSAVGNNRKSREPRIVRIRYRSHTYANSCDPPDCSCVIGSSVICYWLLLAGGHPNRTVRATRLGRSPAATEAIANWWPSKPRGICLQRGALQK
jgi:hypothetical protein